MEFNEKIKQLRLSQDMTLEDVARVVGVGKSTVRKWETGDIANMRRDKIAKLAEALHTSPAYLMGWVDDPYMLSVPSDLSLRGLDPGSEEYKRRADCIVARESNLNDVSLRLGGDISREEYDLVLKYRAASADTKNAARAVLGLSPLETRAEKIG